MFSGMLRLTSCSAVLKSCLWPWVTCAEAGVTACQRGDCCSRTETVTETVPKGLLITQDNPDVSAHSETSSHLCFSLHTLLPLHLLHCEVLSANSHVRKATGRKQNCLAQSLYCQASGVSRGPGFIKCKRLVLKSSATKHVLLSKPLTCFLFPLQCFLRNSEGSCLIRSTNSGGSTWSRIWSEANAMCWKARAASARAAACCQPGWGCRSGHRGPKMISGGGDV